MKPHELFATFRVSVRDAGSGNAKLNQFRGLDFFGKKVAAKYVVMRDVPQDNRPWDNRPKTSPP